MIHAAAEWEGASTICPHGVWRRRGMEGGRRVKRAGWEGDERPRKRGKYTVNKREGNVFIGLLMERRGGARRRQRR